MRSYTPLPFGMPPESMAWRISRFPSLSFCALTFPLTSPAPTNRRPIWFFARPASGKASMLSAFIICEPRIIVIPWERCWVRIWLTDAPIRRFSRSRHASIMIMLSTSGSPVGFRFTPFDSSRRLTNSSRNTMMRGGRMPAGSMSMFSAPCSFCNASRRRPSRSIQSSMAAHSSNPVANPDSLPFTGAKSLPDFTGSPTNACQPCNRAAFTRVTAALVLPLIVCPVISRCAVS